jgi:hypothetical protein
LDVKCRGRLIARVISTPIPNLLNVWLEVTPGMNNIIEVATAPIVVDCRCGASHELDPRRIVELAWRERAGHPRVVRVVDVLVK